MVAVFARQMLVNGQTYPPGYPAGDVGLLETRFDQLVNLRRIVETDDPNIEHLVSTAPVGPLIVADASGAITGAVPENSGLWPCGAGGCSHVSGSARGLGNHEKEEHPNG